MDSFKFGVRSTFIKSVEIKATDFLEAKSILNKEMANGKHGFVDVNGHCEVSISHDDEIVEVF